MEEQLRRALATANGYSSESIDLSTLPPIYILPRLLDPELLLATKDLLTRCGASVTQDAGAARVFLGKVEQKRRAMFELRSLQVITEEVPVPAARRTVPITEPVRKKQKLDRSVNVEAVKLEDSSTESEPDAEVKVKSTQRGSTPAISEANGNMTDRALLDLSVPEGVLVVITPEWLDDCMAAGEALPLEKYTVYIGSRLAPTTPTKAPSQQPLSSSSPAEPAESQTSILSRARAELGPSRGQTSQAWASSSQHRQKGSHHHPNNTNTPTPHSQIPTLLHQTTSEHDFARPSDLPPAPDWVTRQSTYSCERNTPETSPNTPFIDQLKIIRLARKLTADEIGVRAYSTSIAAIAAYPHPITNGAEILRLPGCDQKIAALWLEWREKNSPDRHSPSPVPKSETTTTEAPNSEHQGDVLITAAREATDDPKLQVLRTFYNIWGVGEKTARQFYATGWRDLDDVVEYGWASLSRVQQIGVKYYEEFQCTIPRREVESIAGEIHGAVQRVVKDAEGVRSCIVGGYRRGKEQSGDVDVIVTHLDEGETIDLIQGIVKELVDTGWVTHELSTTTSGSRRGQATLPYRGAGGGHGFDTLDKALVVWQDPRWEGRDELGKDAPAEVVRKKNPNVHRRVDIIVAPWSKIGCAVLGWSAGTTFERDLRRYAKKEKGWKFDSSGVRDRATGNEVDLEMVGKKGRYETVEEAERRVFEGFGLVYREPWERCTG